MEYIDFTITIPDSNNGIVDIGNIILPKADEKERTKKVRITRTSNWWLTEEELKASCQIDLTQLQMMFLIEALYKVIEVPIIYYLDNSGQPVLEIYDDYRE